MYDMGNIQRVAGKVLQPFAVRLGEDPLDIRPALLQTFAEG